MSAARHLPDHPAPLPIRVRPRPTEPIGSYIDRLARANHLKSKDLRTHLCEPPQHRGRPRLNRLAAVSGHSESALLRALTGLQCNACAQVLPSTDLGRPSGWCSPRCRQAAWIQRRRETRAKDPEPFIESICEECDGIVTRDRPVRWCSATCRRAARNRRWRCERCGTRLIPTHRGRPPHWCSAYCRQAAYEDRQRASEARTDSSWTNRLATDQARPRSSTRRGRCHLSPARIAQRD